MSLLPEHAPRGQTRQVAESALANLLSLAVGLSKQNSRCRASVGHDIDVHGYMIPMPYSDSKRVTPSLHGYFLQAKERT